MFIVPQFSTAGPLPPDAPGYKKHVTLNDKIHCVVYVVDTCKVSLLSQKMLDKFAAIRKKSNQLGQQTNILFSEKIRNFYCMYHDSFICVCVCVVMYINVNMEPCHDFFFCTLTGIPQVLLMTKVDEACPLVAENLKNVYHSFYIQKKVVFLNVFMV